MTTAYPFPPLLPEDPAEVAARVSSTLDRAYAELVDAQERVLQVMERPVQAQLAAIRLQQFMDALESFQDRFEDEAARFVRSDLPALYAAAAAAAAAAPFTWTTFHVEAVTALAADTYDDLLARSQEAGRTASAFARAVRVAARERVPLAATGNSTAVETGRRLRDELQDRYDISVVTYANGARHVVGEYTQMLTRTKTAVAYNFGSLNRWRELDVRFVEVFDGGNCGWTSHDDGDRANGSIRRVEDAAANPISHPSCRRAFGARPDVRTPAEAASAIPSTTAEQRADQAASERAGAERSAVRQRAARAQRRADRTAA